MPGSGGQWLAFVAALVAGAATMVLEIAVGRILAPQIGVSLHTWSALIGLVLAGLAVGGWLGGWLVDRWSARVVLAGALVVAAVASLAVAPLADAGVSGWLGAADVMGRVVWLTGRLVIVPAVALGMVVPAAARLAIESSGGRGSAVGRGVGAVYALGALGSIGGTMLTGFVLIDTLGSRRSVALAAAGLALLAVVALGRPRRRVALVGGVALAGTFAAVPGVTGALSGPCIAESAYHCIQIQARPGGQVQLRALLLDKLLHSYSVPDDPTYLEYGYTRYFADLARIQSETHPRLRTLFVGGGGYTVPRYVEAAYPTADVDVIEIDPKVTRSAERYLGLRGDTRVRTFNEDARQFFIQHEGSGGYDLVFGDAFNDLSVPYQLTTREFALQVRDSMAADGVYASNVIDKYPAGDFLRAFLATQRSVFEHVGVVVEPRAVASPWSDGPAPSQQDRATFVVLASAAPLPLARFQDSAFAFSAVQFERLVGGSGLVLTDDYAPVDGLTAKLFLTRY